jgi:hypothetical protein
MLFLCILGKIVLFIVLLLAVILLAVLFIPFKYTAAAEKMENAIVEGTFSWLFGGLKLRFNYDSDNGAAMSAGMLGLNKKIDQGTKRKAHKKSKKEDGRIKKESKKPAYSYFTREVIKSGFQAVLKVLNHCKPGKLILNVQGGLEDPMYTGFLYGIQNVGFAISDKYHIRIELTFEEDELRGNLVVEGGIQLFYLLLVAMEFVFTKPFRSILVKNIKFKIKRRLETWRTISILTKT